MPAAVAPFIPLLTAGVGAAGELIGGKIASNSNKSATKAQLQAQERSQRIQDATQKRAEQVAQEQTGYERSARAPYNAAGNAALTRLGDLLHVGNLSLPTSVPQAGSAKAPAASGGWQGNDPAYIDSQINAGFQQRYGRPPTAEEMTQWQGYATNPTGYSDQKIRTGWNPYLNDRLVNPQSSASSSVSPGDEGVVGMAPSGGTQNLASLLGVGVPSLKSPGSAAPMAQTQDDLIEVLSPQGQRGKIHKSRLQEALADGATVIQ